MERSKQYMGTAGALPPEPTPSSPGELFKKQDAQAKRARMEREFGGHAEHVIAESLARARAICGDDKDPPGIPLGADTSPSRAILTDTSQAQQLSLNL